MLKRSILLCVIIALFFLGITVVNIKSNGLKNSIISDFIKWENGELVENDISDVVGNLERYLSENPKISNNSIMEISNRLRIIEEDGLRIIEYIENPLFYGASAKMSFHIVQYGDSVKLIMSHGSVYIDRLIKSDDGNFILYGYDYKFTNINGIFIAKIIIEEIDIVFSKKMVSFIDEIPLDFRFVGDSLYYRDVSLKFEEFDINSLSVRIVANDGSDFYLRLNEDGVYYVHTN